MADLSDDEHVPSDAEADIPMSQVWAPGAVSPPWRPPAAPDHDTYRSMQGPACVYSFPPLPPLPRPQRLTARDTYRAMQGLPPEFPPGGWVGPTAAGWDEGAAVGQALPSRRRQGPPRL